MWIKEIKTFRSTTKGFSSSATKMSIGINMARKRSTNDGRR